MKAQFVSELVARCINDKTWDLHEDLGYDSAVLQRTVVARKGFKTDFASVPRLPLAYLIAGGTANKPAVIHDWLYWIGETTRKQADEVFLEAMEVVGIEKWRRNLMYAAVRAGAWNVWRKYRKENKNGRS